MAALGKITAIVLNKDENADVAIDGEKKGVRVNVAGKKRFSHEDLGASMDREN